MSPGDPLGNHGQRPIPLAVVFEPVLADEDGMGVSAPLPHQGRAGLRRSAGIERTSASLELARQNPQAALQGAGWTALGALLQLIGEASDDQIATEAQRRLGTSRHSCSLSKDGFLKNAMYREHSETPGTFLFRRRVPR